MMKCLYLLVLVSTWQIVVSTRQHARHHLRAAEGPWIDEDEADSDDHIDIDLWNELNDADIKQMPSTDDFSSERAATRWLKWYSRVSLRYHQV